MNEAERVVRGYYEAFNRGDRERFLALLADDVVHDINQGGREIGKAAFAAFFDRMARAYRERLEAIVVMSTPDGVRAAAEFVVHGEYLASEAGLPAAHGQRYVLPAGAFFELRAGKVSRITNYYNVPDWVRQVSGEDR